jgi:2-keto-4-pentenoate hydratase/2-oxohepta-3-ene-1,7-dioic acid hydratase in catechol pathway
MKIVRFQANNGEIHYGAVDAEDKIEILEGDLFGELRRTGRQGELRKLLSPIVPVTLFGIGLNYRHHAAESGMTPPELPLVFLKSCNTLQNPGDAIQIPTHLPSHEVDYECELAVVIGKTCKNVRREDALEYVFGYTCANDVSARDWQIRKGGGQWCRGKSFDTFCPLGPCITTSDEMPNPNAEGIGIRTILNGERVQDWVTSDMIFDVPALIEFLSGSTTLSAGTVILTGTPHGVGMASKPPRWLQPGDNVSIEIDGIGKLSNPVVLEV